MEMEILNFLKDFSFSKEYITEYTTEFIENNKYTKMDNYQIYDNINEQHLYYVTEFINIALENKLENAKIKIKTKHWKETFIITNNAGEKVLKIEKE